MIAGQMRELLSLHLQACPRCNDEVQQNAALLVDEGGNLTDEQVVAVYEHMMKLHEGHLVH